MTTTGLLMPPPAGNVHWVLFWVKVPLLIGQSFPPTATVTLSAVEPKSKPTKVTVPVPAVLASFDSEYEVNCGAG